MTPAHRKGRIIRVLVSVILLGVVGFFAGRYILYVKIRDTIEHELASLKAQGIHVTYDNLEIYPWDGKLEVHELYVKVKKDSVENDSTARGLTAYLPYITIEGVALLPFLRNKTIAVRKIHSFETYVTYPLNSTLFEQNKISRRNIEVKNIAVKEVNFPQIDFYLTGKDSPDTVAHILTDMNMEDLFLAKQLDSLTWQKGEVNISNFALNYKEENYAISFRNVKLAIEDKSLEVDSFLVKPTISRDAFMRVAGKECSYMEASIPSMKVRSIDWYTFPTPTLQIDLVQMQLITTMYRDKRLPFIQRNDRPLPSHLLQRLPVQLKVDTIRLIESYVRYEEMPEQGDSTGIVFFEGLNASILTLHNNRNLEVDTKMHATAKFMGTGDLDAYFTFPFDTLHSYRVEGSLRNFPLMNINRMLGAAAKAKIESGTMRELKFKFSYTDKKSNGEIKMNYDDLKILTLRENKDNEQSVSYMKTLLLNAFIIQKDLNENDKVKKRTGEIQFYRDTKRSVFNYWWKSILSGIKSAYNLDKLPLNAVNGGEKKKGQKKKIKDIFSRIFKKKN
jgi:hypothetical protein